MMKRTVSISILIGAFALAALSGCAGRQPTRFVEPDWVAAAPTRIHVYMPKPIVINPDDVEDDFGEEAAQFSQWFRSAFAEQLAAHTGSAVRISYIPLDQFKTQQVVLGKKVVPIPEKSDQHPLTDTEIALYIHPVYTSRHQESTPGYYSPGFNGMPGTYVAGHSYSALRYTGNFAYYGQTPSQRLAYGTFVSDVSFSLYIDREDWNKNIVNLVLELLKGTPFETE